MLETNAQEWEEYDSRLPDDGPFVQAARAAKMSRYEYAQSTETSETPFLIEKEGESMEQTETPEHCKCGCRHSVQEASSAESEISTESEGLAGVESDVFSGEAEVPGCSAGCPPPSAQYEKTIRRKGNPEGSVIERTQGDPNVNLALQLFDYDVNEYRLRKNNHRNAVARITEFVVKRLAQTDQPIAVTITGSASRTGGASFNDILSCKRAECVAENLRLGADRFRGFNTRVQINTAGQGFTRATCKGTECELGEFRSVLIQVHSPGNPQPPIPPVDPGWDKYTIRCCSFHSKTLQQALLGDLLNKLLPNVPDALKGKLIGLVKKALDKLVRQLAKQLPKVESALKALNTLLLLFPAEILREDGVFEITERDKPNPRTSVLCYTGFGLRLKVPVNLDDVLDQAFSGPGLSNLPDVVKKALKEAIKKVIPKAIVDRAQPIQSDTPGPIFNFDLLRKKNISVFAGRVLIGKDIFFPGQVDVEFASRPWTVQDPQKRPGITNCQKTTCNVGGIKLTVGEGKGIELLAVSIGDLVQGSCACATSAAVREFETEMPSEVYTETESEMFGETESEMFGETESEMFGEAESEAVGETEGETVGETETETVAETESEAESFVEEMSFEADPYASIRSAMSPEHANLSAEEVSLVLGGMPARVVLHQLLNSPAAQQAALAGLLGGKARHTVRINGSDLSIPAYLRLVSRLSREVAEEYDVPRRGSKPGAPAGGPRGILKYADVQSRTAFYTFFKSAIQGVAGRSKINAQQKAALAEAVADAAMGAFRNHKDQMDCAMKTTSDADSKTQLARALNLSGPWGDAFLGTLQTTAGGDYKSPEQPVKDAADIADQAVLASGHLDDNLWNTFMKCKRP
jgi:hypothetical protein